MFPFSSSSLIDLWLCKNFVCLDPKADFIPNFGMVVSSEFHFNDEKCFHRGPSLKEHLVFLENLSQIANHKESMGKRKINEK